VVRTIESRDRIFRAVAGVDLERMPLIRGMVGLLIIDELLRILGEDFVERWEMVPQLIFLTLHAAGVSTGEA
jgi:hypothetical protein